MIIKSIRASNFMQYEDLILHDIPSNGIIGIFGKNEFGKSTIADVISYSLFGMIPRAKVKGSSLDFTKGDYVRWGAPKCEIFLTFIVNNIEYEIYRKVTAKGSQTAHIKKLNMDGTLTANKVSAVNNYVKKNILGYGFKEFRYSSCVAQKEVDLLTSDAKDVKDVINHMLGIDKLGDAATRCYQYRKNLKDVILPNKQTIIDIQEKNLGNKTIKIHEMKEDETNKKNVEAQISSWKVGLKDCKKEMKKLVKIKSNVEKIDSLSSLLSEKQISIDNLNLQLKVALEANEQLNIIGKNQNNEDQIQKVKREPILIMVKKTMENINIIQEKNDTEKKWLLEKSKAIRKLIGKENQIIDLKKFLKETRNAPLEQEILAHISRLYQNMRSMDPDLREELNEITASLQDNSLKFKEKEEKLQNIQNNKSNESILVQIEGKKAEAKMIKGEREKIKVRRMKLFIGTLTSLSLSLLMYFINQIPISIILTLIAIFTFIKALFAIININKLKTTESTIQEYLLTKQELYGRLCSEAENQDNILEDYRSLESKLQVLAKKSDAISESLKLLDEIDSIEIGAIKEIILDSLVPSLSNIIQELNEINSHEFSSDIFGKLPTLLRNIDEIMTKRIESETKATTLAKDISNKDNEIEDLTQKSEILRNQTSELSILEEKLENNLRILNLEISPNFITELNNELGDIDKLNRTLTIEEGKIPELKKQSDSIPNLKKRIRKMEKDSNILRDKINNLPKKEEFDQDDLDKINDEIIKLEAIITKLNIKKGNFEGSIGEKKNETEDIEKLKETRATLENEMQELSMEYESYNELRKSFNDLQKKIRTGISPQLQQYFSWMLPRITNNRYKMVKVGDDLKMQVYSEERHGFVNLIHLSGGTIDQLLLALRLGFARALSKSRGTDDQLFIFLDEPFSSFDEGRRLAFIDFIKNFEKTFHQIFLISHIDGLENYVDYHIRIEKDSEGNSYAKASWAD